MAKLNYAKLKKELMGLINPDSQMEIEVVERYLDLVKRYRELDQTLEEDGVKVLFRNGSQCFEKINEAYTVKGRINKDLIALAPFFEKKKEELKAAAGKTNFANPSDFL